MIGGALCLSSQSGISTLHVSHFPMTLREALLHRWRAPRTNSNVIIGPRALRAQPMTHSFICRGNGRRRNMYEMCITAAQQRSVCRLSTCLARGLKGQPEQQRAGGGASPPSVAGDERTSQKELDCHLQFVYCIEKNK